MGLRASLAETAQSDDRRFRWRTRDVSRLENLSDIVFALALGLVAASATPTSVAELISMWRHALAVAACFALLLLIWRMHFVFFRRYGLEDGTTVLLNSVLLYCIMAFAYPLKFLASFLIDLAAAMFGVVGPDTIRLSFADSKALIVVYSVGYAALFSVFVLMYAHALRRAAFIGLSEVEKAVTRVDVASSLVHVAISGGVALVAAVLPPHIAVWIPVTYFLIGPVSGLVAWRSEKHIKALETA